MNKPTIICVSGKARHGKDEFVKTAIKYINEYHDYLKVKHLSYGDFVKYAGNKYYNLTYEKNDFNRTMWQKIGTDTGRFNNENIWINMTIELTKGLFNNYDYIFISDVRFPNEIERWIEEGYEVISIRVKRLDFDNGLSEIQKKHPSETSLDHYKFDWVFHNGSLMTYQKEIMKFIDKELI